MRPMNRGNAIRFSFRLYIYIYTHTFLSAAPYSVYRFNAFPGMGFTDPTVRVPYVYITGAPNRVQ